MNTKQSNEENVNESLSEECDSSFEITRCIRWIDQNQFKIICLQFPRSMLKCSTKVFRLFQSNYPKAKFYILADSYYDSCCIDYAAAQHVNADAIIHFGVVCITKSISPIPYLYVYEKHELKTSSFLHAFRKLFNAFDESVLLVYDTPFSYCIENISEDLSKDYRKLITCSISDWKRLKSIFTNSQSVVYLGSNDRKLFIFKNSFDFENRDLLFVRIDENTNEYSFDKNIEIQTLKRSNFLIQKIRNASTIGILMSTISVANYLRIADRLKAICRLRQKKFFTISIGKITPAKLAQFPEIDIFVLISCPLNLAYESREFFRPLASVSDFEIAMNCRKEIQYLRFYFDFDEILAREILPNLNDDENGDGDGDVSDEENIEKCNRQLIQLSSHGRIDGTWNGLEIQRGQTDVKMVEVGRTGLASVYLNEKHSDSTQ